MRPATTAAIAVFVLVALLHLVRFAAGWDFVIGDYAVPLWVSAAAVIVAGGLAIALARERSG